MKLSYLVIGQLAVLLFYAIFAISGPNSGEVVAPNEIALVVNRTSFTQAQTATDANNSAAPLDNVKDSEMEVYHGRRIPLSKTLNPALYTFNFYLGVQDYEFSGRSSYESEDNNPISISTAGDTVNFDVNVQVEIDTSLEQKDLARKLFRFIQNEKLASVKGENNLLAYWAKSRMKQVIERIFRTQLATSQVLDAIREKEKLNENLRTALNDYVKGYGLRFRSAAVTSAMHLPASLKGNMLNAVRLEYAAIANKQRQEQLVPLITKLQKFEMDGNQLIQDEENRGEQESMVAIADAFKQRRTSLVGILGKENYAAFEQMHMLRENLLKSGRTKVVVAPTGMQLLTGLESLPMPTVLDSSADNLIHTSEIGEHGVIDSDNNPNTKKK